MTADTFVAHEDGAFRCYTTRSGIDRQYRGCAHTTPRQAINCGFPASGSSLAASRTATDGPLAETPESRLGRAPGSGVSLPAAATSPLRGRRALMPSAAPDVEPVAGVHGSEPSFGF